MTKSKSSSLFAGLSLLMAPAAFAADPAGSDPWYMNTTHWAFLTLIVFMVIVWRLGAFKAIFSSLDKRADEIQYELEQAQSMREEAASKLKEAERLQQEAAEQAEAIMRQAESDAKALSSQAEKDLDDMVTRREKQVEARIARAEADAKAAVKSIAAEAATRAAGEVIRAQADATKGKDAFQNALSQVKATL